MLGEPISMPGTARPTASGRSVSRRRLPAHGLLLHNLLPAPYGRTPTRRKYHALPCRSPVPSHRPVGLSLRSLPPRLYRPRPNSSHNSGPTSRGSPVRHPATEPSTATQQPASYARQKYSAGKRVLGHLIFLSRWMCGLQVRGRPA